MYEVVHNGYCSDSLRLPILYVHVELYVTTNFKPLFSRWGMLIGRHGSNWFLALIFGPPHSNPSYIPELYGTCKYEFQMTATMKHLLDFSSKLCTNYYCQVMAMTQSPSTLDILIWQFLSLLFIHSWCGTYYQAILGLMNMSVINCNEFASSEQCAKKS